MTGAVSRTRPGALLATSILVIALSAIALAAGGLARGAPAIQGVHGGGTRTSFGFTDHYSISVTRQPSGAVSGHLQVGGATPMVQATPNGLSISGNEACVTGLLTRAPSGAETAQGIAILIRDVPDGRDLIIFALVDGPPGEPPFGCAALARGMEIFHPELTTGNFTFIGN
jgi:hypothetical protein